MTASRPEIVVAEPATITPKQVSPTPYQPKSRLTVVETVYYAPTGQEPTASTCRFSAEVESDEQPWKRIQKIGPQWVWIPIELGWVPEPKMLKLVASEDSELGIGVDDDRYITPITLLPKGQSYRHFPFVGVSLFVRSRSEGQTTVEIFAIPK